MLLSLIQIMNKCCEFPKWERIVWSYQLIKKYRKEMYYTTDYSSSCTYPWHLVIGLLIILLLSILLIATWKIIPQEVWNCGASARILDLSHNSILEVPCTIIHLTSLQVGRALLSSTWLFICKFSLDWWKRMFYSILIMTETDPKWQQHIWWSTKLGSISSIKVFNCIVIEP